MADGFDIRELEEYERNLLNLAEKRMPKQSKKFIRKEGKKLLQRTQNEAIFSGLKHKSHNYYNGIKQGKVYKYVHNGALSNRVYNSASHAHLIEHGHRLVTHDGKEIGFLRGYKIFENAERHFTHEYFDDVQKFIDDVLDEGL